jgi:hypothetical protein
VSKNSLWVGKYIRIAEKEKTTSINILLLSSDIKKKKR